MSDAMPEQAASIGRPWKRAAAWLAFLAPFFYLTYGVANALAAARAQVSAIVFGWEHFVPFLDWTILPYWSINLFYGASLFVCRDRDELDAHAKRLFAAQLVAVSFFVLTPLAFTFARPATDGWPGFMFAALTSFDKPFNQAPSLHIALMIILWSLYTQVLRGAWRWAFHAWFFLIGASVLTTYQHHFIDIPTGLWLGWFCVALFPLQAQHRASAWWPLRWHPRHWTGDARARQLAQRYALAALPLALLGLAVTNAARAAQRPVAFDGGVLAGAAASLLGPLLVWSALSLLLVAAIYLSGDARKFQKHHTGRISAAVRWLLGPYLLGAWLNSRWWTRADAPRAEVAHGVWLSRVPSTAELARHRPGAIVDLIAELPLVAAFVVRLPVLDLTVPSPAVLRAAADAIEHSRAGARGDAVWVCCALGYSRSASAVATWLLRTRRAGDRAQAEQLLRACRPRMVLSDAHWTAIDEAART
jgi:protein-tyrosine phosphatase